MKPVRLRPAAIATGGHMPELSVEEQVKTDMLTFLKEGEFEVRSAGGKIHVNIFDKTKYFQTISKLLKAKPQHGLSDATMNALMHYWDQKRG
jgi:hypothetical protein